ncbi:MAG: proline--tRNA ligase [Planctomycetota bacterium]
MTPPSDHTSRSVRLGEVHRWTQTSIPTLREAPAEATTPSHQLLVRGGYIRQVAAGVYSFLPLGLRVLEKISQIVREEMNAAGAAELRMPAFVPIELYAGTKRDEAYGDLLFKLTDRHGRSVALGPTHEETLTDYAKSAVTSYKQLPLTLYQIQTKYRDEFRPRAGLLRGREFVMKDAYSMHTSVEGPGGLNEVYDRLYEAYVRIFERCGLGFTVVEAEAGPIGGSASHEFMVNAATGEDTILICPASGYAANVEKCEIGERPWSIADADAAQPLAEHHTPKMPGIDAVASHLGIEPRGMLKTILFKAGRAGDDPAWVLATVRGDHEVNEGKLRDAVGRSLTLADDAEARAAGFAVGYISPRAATERGCQLVIDPDAATDDAWATGADRVDHHVTGFSWRRDAGVSSASAANLAGVKVADIRNAKAGDPSPKDPASTLEARRGIEVGHIFKLGTIYSEAFDFAILNEQQKKTTVIMGCYGIGVSRTIAASVEQRHDDRGIVWPAPIAPYDVLVVVMDPKKPAHAEAVATITDQLRGAGLDVLVDDRKERPGVKFKDADLIGMPIRLTIGDKALERGMVEFQVRAGSAERQEVPLAAIVEPVLGALGG